MHAPLSSASPVDASPPETGVVPARIWLADDSSVEVQHTRGVLARAHHAVETFPDGASLLERFAQPGVEAPDLLLLDWYMPGVSGLDVCRFLRERFTRARLPILVLTASTHPGDIEEAFGAGANDVVAKPAHGPQLLARVRTHLEMREQSEALRTREAELQTFRALIDASSDFIAFGRPDGRLEYLNPAGQRLLGVKGLEEARGLNAADCFPPETSARSMAAMFPLVLSGGYFQGEHLFRNRETGESIPMLQDAFGVRGPDGQLLAVATVSRDLRARKRAEALREALLAREQAARAEAEAERTRLTTILSTLEEGVILQDAQGTVRYCNAAAERLLGLNSEQMDGLTSASPHWGAEWPDGRPAPGEDHAPMRALRTGQGITGDLLGVRHADGRRLWLSINAQPYFEQDGRTLVGVVSSFLDVTAQRAAQAERERLLREVEAARVRLASLIEHAPAIICTLRGPEHVYELINPPHQRLIGMDRAVVGLPMREAVPETVDQGLIEKLDHVYRTGEPSFGREVPLRFERGGDGALQNHFINFVYQPTRDAAGRVVGIDVFGFDVTEQVRARHEVEALAERLRESEERLRRVVEASGIGTWELDVPTGQVTADARHLTLLGLPSDAALESATAFEVIHVEDRPHVERAVTAALAHQDGGAHLTEFRAVGPGNPHERWLEVRGQALFDAQGRPARLIGTTLDITARKAADSAREELLEALSGQPVFGVALIHGPRLVFERVNAAYRQLVGNRDVAGKPLLEALPELEGQGFDTKLYGVQRTSVPLIGREVHTRLDRRGQGVVEDAYYNYVFQPVRTPGGAYDDVLIITHDVTDMVHARQAAERLTALEKERAGFEQQLIGIVSHDLRTPITAISMGAAVLLRRPDVEERQRRTVERILTSAGRANRMIHDLLDFTQARLGGGLSARRVPGDFHAIVRQVVEESQVANPQRALRLTQTGGGEGDWDADRLGQLVGNLLSNALHYSPTSAPVRLETRGEPDDVVLEVHNAGAPISPELLPRLFQPMQRGVADVSEVRSVGLGLYIVDQVVRAHGGAVEVASTAEAGTTFIVRLPRKRR
jgi:PAS domain S-box-containing protein